ncbi:Swi3-domain-containing protein [Tothia fuscella]|uniref:Chromosome segregation in meiosis protein n=1 Tax=Tothia fuscella TaxID=1048955 RepID=A0A9P4NK10_9PEZI|nr:Swi3-domain-containing protein [Tothia fuscella]
MAPSAVSSGVDDLDALFDVEPGMDDPFDAVHDNFNSDGNNTREPIREPSVSARRTEGLGLDEEVKIVKKRQPVAKLDATRLLTDPGIPKLQRISKNRLKFRGKGHEFSDVAQLLRTYQMWLDDLYPRAKFADGLAIIEKLGHSKRLQIMRKAWIDECKPKAPQDDEEDDEHSLSRTVNPSTENITHINHANGSPSDPAECVQPPASVPSDEIGETGPDDDELDALMAEETQIEPGKRTSHEMTSGVSLPQPLPPTHAVDDDDEDMLREMGMW